MEPDDKIFVAGHRGLVGSALVRRLLVAGFRNLVLRDRAELDLTRQSAVNAFFEAIRPKYVFLAAAKVGGIVANIEQPAQFLYTNLAIQCNVIDAAYRSGVSKFLFLGSSCIYPRHAPQPMPESCLMTGALEPTNEAYALGKIAGIKMCQTYGLQYGFNTVCVIPTNLYGPGDNFSLHHGHVLPALLRKFHEAKEHNSAEVEIWGTGRPRRELLFVDDLAEACLYLMQNYDGDCLINVGWGADTSIAELAGTIARVVDFRGTISFNTSKPDGMPQKLLDTTRLMELGWRPKVTLEEGIRATYRWFLAHPEQVRH